jgi:hypothetical protein
MRRVAVVDLIYGLTLLSFLVLVVSSHASWALEDKRNERGETWGLVANLFHRNPNAAVIETAATSPQLRHDADATISIENHDRQRSCSTPTSDVNQSSCSQRSHAHHSKKQKFGWWRPRIKKERRQLSRRAYRMAILASLAYHDFRDYPIHHDANINSTRDTNSSRSSNRMWAFSLADDPPPAQYLLEGRSGNDGKKLVRRKTTWKHGTTAPKVVSGMVARFHVSICRVKSSFATSRRKGRRKRGLVEKMFTTLVSKNSMQQRTNGTQTPDQCKVNVLKKHEGGKHYNIKYVLSDWHEEQAKIRWHDTDLIIATSGSSELVIAFAGTASPADAVTNIQTLEPISHSGFFHSKDFENKKKTKRIFNATSIQSSSLEGNIHRGYLNAYARVIRGKIRKLDDDGVHNDHSSSMLTMPLDEYFSTCLVSQQLRNTSDSSTEKVNNVTTMSIVDKHKKRKKKPRHRDEATTCHSSGYRLMDMLRNITTMALQSGHTVHVVGHSLAGALATIHALDIAMNHKATPIHHLHLWTFGAPEVADSLFFESAGAYSVRMRDFFSDATRYHRYVTQSETNCDTDVVASIASKSLNRRAVRRLGGVRGNVMHTIEPLYLPVNGTINGMELHELKSYLSGISSTISSSSDYQDVALSTDFPLQMKSWLGEAT